MTAHITIGWLYPTALSTYGDRGNVLALTQRARWRGFDARVVRIERYDDIPTDVDIFFIGGGQDRAQVQVASTLNRFHGSVLRERLSDGAALLAVCGGYQLLCHEYVTLKCERIAGLGIFDAVTRAARERLVGNVGLCTRWGPVAGFENHSGRTYLGPTAEPLGAVESGHGNNGKDRTEGAVCGSAIGSYLHGALLPRNPALADWLLLQGIRRTRPMRDLAPLPNAWEMATHAKPGRPH